MAERVDTAPWSIRDRVRASRRVRVFVHWTVLDSPGRQRACVHRDGIVHEELDPHGRESADAGLRVP